MDSVGALRKAHSFGLYTLPSHISMFAGYPPNVTELPHADYYSREAKQLFRLARGRRKAPESYERLLRGPTIFSGLRDENYFSLGVGGVRWFMSRLLTDHFDEFLFWGPDDYEDFFRGRTEEEHALLHQKEIVERLQLHDKWILFVNCLETHVPYDTPGSPLTPEASEILARGRPVWAGRTSGLAEHKPSMNEFRLLHRAQIRACEWVDNQLAELFTKLRGQPVVVLITGDHGEVFGEDGLWGHGFPHPLVVDVPLIVGFSG